MPGVISHRSNPRVWDPRRVGGGGSVMTFHPLLVHPCSFLMTTMLLPHFPQQLRCAQYLMFTIHIPHCFLIYAMSFSSISSMHSCNLVFSRPLIGTKLYYLKRS